VQFAFAAVTTQNASWWIALPCCVETGIKLRETCLFDAKPLGKKENSAFMDEWMSYLVLVTPNDRVTS